MQLEATQCYLCNSPNYRPWAQENGFQMVKCANCGLVYLNPRPSLEEIDEAARTGLHKFGTGALNTVGARSTRKMRDYEECLKALLPAETWNDPSLRWLDIGAGFGELVEAVRNLGGAEIRGIEPCAPKVRKAQAAGLPVDAAGLSEVKGLYSHVSLINVFSHVPDPVEFLSGLAHFLRPGGSLVLVTGNGGDIPRAEYPGALYLPDHLSFAGEGNLRHALDCAGYDVVKIDSYAVTQSFDPPAISALKNVARKLTGRPAVPLHFPKNSRFRSMWIHAQKLSQN